MRTKIILRVLAPVVVALSAALALVPSASASTVNAVSQSTGVYLVVSSTPLPGPPAGSVSPDISRVNCSSGNDLTWVRLYLDAGGATCYGDKGTLSGLNDGPAYQLCSGNNSGYVTTDIGYFTFGPVNGSTPNYYYYEDDEGDIIPFYVQSIQITGWNGSAEC